MADIATQVRATAPESVGRLVTTSAIGTAIEWYDFFLFALMATTVFDVIFFPKLDPAAATIASFSTFAVGYIARPIGGLVFGHFGDRIGRKTVLFTTILMMGLSTTAIGFLPSYQQIGVLAPVALVTLRFLQGLAVGGEAIGAIVLTLEGVPASKRGFYASLVQLAGPLGIVGASLAMSLVTMLGRDILLDWGWRLPFLASAALLGVGTYLRATVRESEHFERLAQERKLSKAPIVEVLANHKRALATSIIYLAAHSSYFYVVTIFAISHGTKNLGLSAAGMNNSYFYANVCGVLFIPFVGKLVDKFGRKPLLITGLSCEILFVGLYFWMLGLGQPWLATVAMIIAAGLINPICFATEGSYIPELFDTRTRFTGASVAKQVGNVIGGGLVPLIATSLYLWGGNSILPVIAYIMAFDLLAIAAIAYSRETKDKTF